MKTPIVHPALAALRGAALGLLGLGWLTVALPETGAADTWGRLANPGFNGQRIKTTYFFAGQANDGSRYLLPDGTGTNFDCYIAPNLNTYTLKPAPEELHQNWTEANRSTVLDMITNAGINVITMSSWGEDFLPCTDNWATGAAPMQTSPYAQDGLFTSATKKPLLIMPYIESRLNTWSMREEFPRWTDGRVSPGLVSQITNLVHRYVQNPAHPEWANVWAKVYDHNGTHRYAVGLIHAASDNLPIFGSDDLFAAGFDLVANEVARLTGVQVGFFIDAAPLDSTLANARFKASPQLTGPYLFNTASFLGIQCFAPEIFTGESGDDDLLAWKRNFISGWFSTGIPVLVDVSPGYDGHIVFGPNSKGTYGYSDEWIQGLTALVNDYGRSGMVYNSWNGYTEGMAGTPTREKGTILYDWLKSLNSSRRIYVDRNFPGNGNGSLSEPFSTVTAANVEASDGDVIQIRTGNYPEAITISKRLTLQVEAGPVTIGP